MKYLLFFALFSAQQSDCERALVEFASGLYEEALVSMQQCIAHDTTNYRIFFLKGRTLENLYRYNEAITALQKAFQLNPDSRGAKSALASLYLTSGQPEVSAQFYEKLVAAEPHINRWKISWARAFMAAGNFQDALEQLLIVEQTDTTNWLLYRLIGDCYFRLGKNWGAYQHYYYSLRLNPYNKSLWGTLMGLLVTNNEITGAIEVGNEAVSIDSTNVDAWRFLGVAYYRNGNLRQALNALENALALGDSTFMTLGHFGILNYHLAQSRASMAHFLEAEKYLEKAYQMDPLSLTIMNYLVSTYARTHAFTRNGQRGLDILDELDMRIAEFDSIGKRANIQRGHLLRRMNRNLEAANVFIAATRDFPNELINFYEVALSYDRANERRLAIDWYTRYLERIDPNWATKQWTTQELEKYEFVSVAMRRIYILRTDLFFEGN